MEERLKRKNELVNFFVDDLSHVQSHLKFIKLPSGVMLSNLL